MYRPLCCSPQARVSKLSTNRPISCSRLMNLLGTCPPTRRTPSFPAPCQPRIVTQNAPLHTPAMAFRARQCARWRPSLPNFRQRVESPNESALCLPHENKRKLAVSFHSGSLMPFVQFMLFSSQNRNRLIRFRCCPLLQKKTRNRHLGLRRPNRNLDQTRPKGRLKTTRLPLR